MKKTFRFITNLIGFFITLGCIVVLLYAAISFLIFGYMKLMSL